MAISSLTPLTGAPFPYRIPPLTNITPFTYRDGETYLTILEKLRSYIVGTLVPETDDKLAALHADILALSTAWDAKFAQFMADLLDFVEELNDTAVAELIKDLDSKTAIALVSLIGERVDIEIADHIINPMGKPFNCKFDGVTDDSVGLQAAVNMGGTIALPNRPFVAKDIAIGSHTWVAGGPKSKMIIPDGAPWDARGFYFKPGSEHSRLSDVTVDGNQANRNHNGGTGGIFGTNVSVVQSTYIKVEHVRSINAMQHCFDVTGDKYYDLGDGATAPNGSKHVWFTDCEGEFSGDDVFTTHGSSRIWFTRCVGGKTWWKPLVAYQNCNAFEIDDYSHDVTLTDCHGYESAHGFEIKAHKTMSAGANVRLIGCTAENNEINYNFRHISHHVNYPNNPAVLSVSAKNIQMIGCTSKHPLPVFTGGTSGKVVQVHGLMIGAYKGVQITNYTDIGDPSYDYRGSTPVVFHYLCGDISITDYHISGYTTSTYDIHATGGTQPASNIRISGGMHKDSAPSAISCGSAAKARINGITISRNVLGSPNKSGVRAFGDCIIRDVRFDFPFEIPYQVRYSTYSSYETPTAEIIKIADLPETPDAGEIIDDPAT